MLRRRRLICGGRSNGDCGRRVLAFCPRRGDLPAGALYLLGLAGFDLGSLGLLELLWLLDLLGLGASRYRLPAAPPPPSGAPAGQGRGEPKYTKPHQNIIAYL